MSGIAHITNFPPRAITDGGTHREEALASFLARQGAVRLVVQDESFRRTRIGRLTRLTRLFREVRRLQPELLVLSYPAYPFFWQHKITVYAVTSLLFAERLRRLAKGRSAVVIDVMDLPVFQHEDLGYGLEMSEPTLKWFDRFFFSRADFLWVCSESIAQVINEQYGIEESALIVALNGHDMDIQPRADRDPGRIKFAYAGSLNPERGIEAVVEAFLASGVDAELHAAGPHGDWLRMRADQGRVYYHGAMTDEQACAVLAGCDIGLIPYPERGYYHLAFATKLPFYLALGMPVLCSEARETATHVRRLGIGTCAPISSFAEAFREIASDCGRVEVWRNNVRNVRGEFSWTSIYSRALEDTRRGRGRRGCA